MPSLVTLLAYSAPGKKLLACVHALAEINQLKSFPQPFSHVGPFTVSLNLQCQDQRGFLPPCLGSFPSHLSFSPLPDSILTSSQWYSHTQRSKQNCKDA